MCVPTRYMLLGQWVMFKIAPEYAAGLCPSVKHLRTRVYCRYRRPGRQVRFYRTIILNEINKDYVALRAQKAFPFRQYCSARAQELHAPILTELITTIPFLILGSLLSNGFSGFPGWAIFAHQHTSRDVPLLRLTYLTAVCSGEPAIRCALRGVRSADSFTIRIRIRLTTETQSSQRKE